MFERVDSCRRREVIDRDRTQPAIVGHGLIKRFGAVSSTVATLTQMTSNLPLVACSLNSADRQKRLSDWAELLSQARTRRETSDGVRYAFAADAELKPRVEALAAVEYNCCSFLAFEIAEVVDELELTVTAPPNGQEALRFIFARGDTVIEGTTA